jgi:hypothetical protein
MKKMFTVFCLVLLILSSFSGMAAAEPETNIGELTKEEKDLLKGLEGKKDKLKFGLTDKDVSDEELEAVSYEGKESLTAKELEKYIKKNKSLVQIQIFEDDTNTQVLSTTVKSLKKIQDLVELTPTEEVQKANENEAYYKVPYTMIISTVDYTGFYSFDRFYINNMDAIDHEELKGIASYMKESNHHNKLDVKFIKNVEPTEELETGEVGAQCIACVGDIYTVASTSYYNAWTNVAQVHAIKGVSTTFTLSSSKTATTTIQTKVVSPAGSVESSGSSSKTFSSVTQYPTLTGSSLSSPGRYAQTEIRYAKTRYTKVKGSGPSEYTKVSAYQVLGGTRWGSYIYANGASYSSVTGPSYLPGSVHTATQEKSNTFTAQAGTTVYSTSVSLSATTASTAQNKWKFSFGSGYTRYKIYNYGSKFNLTAY